MTTLVKNIVTELMPDESRDGFLFKMEKLPDCYADATLLRQVIINLISNAIKYTKPCAKKEIVIDGKIVNGEIVYSVQDTGVGFDSTYKHKLFGTFQRLHGEKEFEGTGVGLAIVKRIIERHMGRVWAEGELNAGAAFFFTIPNRKYEE
jgi:light-regulated signal transduction histidine kinase (bacteriophytochrome)